MTTRCLSFDSSKRGVGVVVRVPHSLSFLFSLLSLLKAKPTCRLRRGCPIPILLHYLSLCAYPGKNGGAIDFTRNLMSQVVARRYRWIFFPVYLGANGYNCAVFWPGQHQNLHKRRIPSLGLGWPGLAVCRCLAQARMAASGERLSWNHHHHHDRHHPKTRCFGTRLSRASSRTTQTTRIRYSVVIWPSGERGCSSSSWQMSRQTFSVFCV